MVFYIDRNGRYDFSDENTIILKVEMTDEEKKRRYS